jgi:hypothetical protein
MNYCGKDVYTMMLIKRAIDSYAVTVPGLTASIQQAMDAIPVYRLMTLQGISFDTKLRDAQMADNDGMMNEYIRIANWFIGEETQAALKSKGNTSLLASNTKCVHYFHNMLDYPVVARSKVTGNASLAKGAMFKLKLKHENPVIDLVLAYRDMAKESGSLKFDLWKE